MDRGFELPMRARRVSSGDTGVRAFRHPGPTRFGTVLRVTTPPSWSYGRFVLGCGTFGGIGGSPKLVGRGLDEPSAFATLDEAVGLGITLFDTAERYAGGASEIMIGRWLVERDSAVTERVRLATKVAPPDVDGPGAADIGAALIDSQPLHPAAD
jgi:Aldo/keto reductase family